MPARAPKASIETHPLTPDRWRDFAALMESRFDTRHCWCMAPRLATSYRTRTGAANRRAMKKVVDSAPAPPGVLAYIDGEPVGWCAVAPRPDFPRIDRVASRATSGDTDVWAVVCFYVLRHARRQGVSKALLAAAIRISQEHGARSVEGYPVEGGNNPYRGFPSVFRAARFNEVARLRANRPLLRYQTRSKRRTS
jgi:GNAT superfamily N-acetyltransferase